MLDVFHSRGMPLVMFPRIRDSGFGLETSALSPSLWKRAHFLLLWQRERSLFHSGNERSLSFSLETSALSLFHSGNERTLFFSLEKSALSLSLETKALSLFLWQRERSLFLSTPTISRQSAVSCSPRQHLTAGSRFAEG